MDRTILIVDDDRDVLAGLSALVGSFGWTVLTADSGREALRQFALLNPDTVLLDVRLPDLSGIEVLEQIKALSEQTPVIMMSGAGTIEQAVRAIHQGAEQFIRKPYDSDALEALLEQVTRSIAAQRQLDALRRARPFQTTLLGISEVIRRLNATIERVAPAPSPVLLQGESGTGKGLVAALLHQLSPRSGAPFVDINCAGLSRELLESELFGHERGAFTGAHAPKQGLLEIASGGSLFLDEIGEMDPAIQARLLKALEDKRFRRVGGVRDIRVEVRILAATNRDLQQEVAEKRFREDLYFRLNVIGITIPPLRERQEDIPLLVDFFLERLRRELGTRKIEVSSRALQLLVNYSWPGNVRELRNVLERAMLLSEGREIQGQELHLTGPEPQPLGQTGIPTPLSEADIRSLDEVIRSYARSAVAAAKGNMRSTARRLGISPSTLYSKLRNGEEPK